MNKFVIKWIPYNCYKSKSNSNRQRFVSDIKSPDIKIWKTLSGARKFYASRLYSKDFCIVMID